MCECIQLLEPVRCPKCGRKLAELSGRARLRCPRCKSFVDAVVECNEFNIKVERLERQS